MRTCVQNPNESIRNFAYDYRALCLKWKPDINEAALVRHILCHDNPKIAAGLRGMVNTVAELVKVGSMIENDLASMKNYWIRVNNDKTSKQQPNTKKVLL